MQRFIFMIIASLFASVCMGANGTEPATLVFKNNDVTSANVLSNEIHISRRIFDGQGNLIIIGGFSGEASFGDTLVKAKGKLDFFLAKFTTTGQRIWSTFQGGVNSEIGYDFAVDQYGAINVVGSFGPSCLFYGKTLIAKGGQDGFLAKFDSRGRYLWVKIIASSVGEDGAYSIAIGTGGYVYVGGTFTGTAQFAGDTSITSKGGNDIFVLKLTPDGTLVRAWSYGDARDVYFSRIAIGPTGNVCIVWKELSKDMVQEKNQSFFWFDADGKAVSKVPGRITQ